jgi:hypothetical protein
MLCLDVNEVTYLLYFFGLVGWAPVSFVRRTIYGLGGMVALRSEENINKLHSFFVGFTALNLGLAQVVMPLLPAPTNKFAFLMLVVETAASAQLVCRDTKNREWIISIPIKFRKD